MAKKRLPLPRIRMDWSPSPVRLYTRKRVADLWGVTIWSVKRWQDEGLMPPPVILPNGRYAWPEDVLIEFVKSLPKAGA